MIAIQAASKAKQGKALLRGSERLYPATIAGSLTCCGRPQEEATALSLKCNISIEVNDLSEGLQLGLKDDREKNLRGAGAPCPVRRCCPALFAGPPPALHCLE